MGHTHVYVPAKSLAYWKIHKNNLAMQHQNPSSIKNFMDKRLDSTANKLQGNKHKGKALD